MRFIVLGTGAVGSVVGARLHQSGQDVVFIARGPQYDAISAHGLRIESPQETVTLTVSSVRSPSEIEFNPDDIVLLTVKSQHTFAAVQDLAQHAPKTIAVVCVQNGVENERLALRHFANVYGAVPMCPSIYVRPGMVQCNSSPVSAIIDLGRYPAAVDDTASWIGNAFGNATIDSQAKEHIARWKYAKLIHSLANAIEVVCDRDARRGPINDRVVEEGEACLRAAGIDFASNAEDKARRGSILKPQQIGDVTRETSTMQSVTRNTGSIETDYLNGEIVLLGRLHGIETPVNAALQHYATEFARGRAIAKMSEKEFLAAAESGSY